MDDKLIFEQMREGPLKRDGFDEELRARVHTRLREGQRRSSRRGRLIPPGIAAAFVLIGLLCYGLMQMSGDGPGWQQEKLHVEAEAPPVNELAPPSLQAAATPSGTMRSAMLLGLRKDEVNEVDSDMAYEKSSYRTLLVVPEGLQLKVAAVKEGIWMPYLQHFWRIDNLKSASMQQGQTLVASQLGLTVNNSSDEGRLQNGVSEKLLFAGNQYVSIAQTVLPLMKKKDEQPSEAHVWIKDVTQLTLAARTKQTDEPHYKLGVLIDLKREGGEDHYSVAEEWAIARSGGKWVAKVPPFGAIEPPITNDVLATWAEQLPLIPDVVSHDELFLDWSEITAIEPAARDAFTSPTEDMVAIEVDGGIDIYPYLTGGYTGRPLMLPLDRNESIVMVQWAEDHNVNKWTQMLGQ